MKHPSLPSAAVQARSEDRPEAQGNAAADVRVTATLTPGAKTQRVATVRTLKRSKAIKTSARRLLKDRTATVTVCISLDVADLAAIDADADASRLARSTYLVECWRKARQP